MSTIVLEPPAAPALLNRPLRCDGSETDDDGDYLFYEGYAIVYRIVADCFVCAWKDGHPRFPRALMAVTFAMEPSDLKRPTCHCETKGRGRESFVFYEGDVIVGILPEYCPLKAWKEGHPQWPVAELAATIPMVPADMYRECQREVNRRKFGR